MRTDYEKYTKANSIFFACICIDHCMVYKGVIGVGWSISTSIIVESRVSKTILVLFSLKSIVRNMKFLIAVFFIVSLVVLCQVSFICIRSHWKQCCGSDDLFISIKFIKFQGEQLSKEGRRKQIELLAKKCQETEKATDFDVQETLDHELPSTDTGKCLRACIMESLGMVRQHVTCDGGSSQIISFVNFTFCSCKGRNSIWRLLSHWPCKKQPIPSCRMCWKKLLSNASH